MSLTLKLLLVGLLLAKGIAMISLVAGPFNFSEVFSGWGLAFAEETKQVKQNIAGSDPSPQETKAVKMPETKTETQVSEEIKIKLNGLEKKRIENQKTEKKLEAEKTALENLKLEIQSKIEKMAKLNKQMEERLKMLDQGETEAEKIKKAAEEKKLKQLVKVYSAMKPKDAGPIIDKLDIKVAEKIFLRMKGDKAGKILSYVSRERAAKISERVARPNKTKTRK